jgi:hypothetical protein
MQRLAICSEEMRAKNGGVYRVLLTVLSNRKPEYMLLNLMDVSPEERLEQGKTYRITIEEEGD